MCLDITCLLPLRGGHLLNTSPPSVKTSFPTVENVLNRFWLLVGQPDGCEGGVYIDRLVAAISPPPRLQLTNCWRQRRSKSAAARHHSAAGRSSDLTCAAHRTLLANWEKNRYKHTEKKQILQSGQHTYLLQHDFAHKHKDNSRHNDRKYTSYLSPPKISALQKKNYQKHDQGK